MLLFVLWFYILLFACFCCDIVFYLESLLSLESLSFGSLLYCVLYWHFEVPFIFSFLFVWIFAVFVWIYCCLLFCCLFYLLWVWFTSFCSFLFFLYFWFGVVCLRWVSLLICIVFCSLFSNKIGVLFIISFVWLFVCLSGFEVVLTQTALFFVCLFLF